MPKQNSTTSHKKAKYVNRVVYLGKYNFEEFDILIQVVGNVFQYILHDNLTKEWYQQYVEDRDHAFDFDYLQDKETLKKAAAHFFDMAIGHCNTLRNYKKHMAEFEANEKKAEETKKKAKHIKMNVEELPTVKPVEGVENGN